MKLIKQANSAHVLDLDDIQILFSYETPVAVWITGSHFLVTEIDYSRTTNKHINQFIRDRSYNETKVVGRDDVEFVPQSAIENSIMEAV